MLITSMSSLQQILHQFEPISLSTLEKDYSASRVETKFTLFLENLPDFLQALLPFYNVLFLNTNSVLTYTTRYFDTPEFAMYLAHHNGVLNRYKIRERTYIDTQRSYLEIKFRTNTNRVIKQRLGLHSLESQWMEPEHHFIASRTPYDPKRLFPSLSNRYNRIMLVNKRGGDRVTVDFNLEFTNAFSCYKLSKFGIVEIKQAIKSKTPALAALQILRMRPRSFSKYCFGISCLYPALKKNNFKEKFSAIYNPVNDHSDNVIAGI